MAETRTVIPGFWILEGIDGSGTTTQKDLLCRALAAAGRNVMDTREPTDGPVGLLIRRALRKEIRLSDRTLALLFAADREEHVHCLAEHCGSGGVAVSDRYLHSSLAYQGLVCDPAWVEGLNHGFPAPECLFFLDLPVEVSSRRRKLRGEEEELFDDDGFQDRVRKAYHRVLEREQALSPGMACHVLDATEGVNALHRRICGLAGIPPIQ